MKRWAKRSLVSIGLLLAAGLLLLVIGLSMFRATPSWYVPTALEPARRQQFAQAAENKMIAAQNWAAELRADGVRATRADEQGATRPATRAASAHIAEFSQDELNALFEKWSVLYGWS